MSNRWNTVFQNLDLWLSQFKVHKTKANWIYGTCRRLTVHLYLFS